MSVNVFPAPSTGGGGGGGSSLPEGAVSQIVQGRLTALGFDYPETLAAGDYLVNTKGNSLQVTAGDAGITQTISGSGTLTLPGSESNLSFALSEQLAGEPVEIIPNLPMPVISGFGTSYSGGGDFTIDSETGSMALVRGNSSGSTQVLIGFRQDDGQLRARLFVGVANDKYTAAAIRGDNLYFAFCINGSTDHRIMKYNWRTGVLTYVHTGGTFLNDATGFTGLMVSEDEQTIIGVGFNTNKTITTNNGGTSWTSVTTPSSVFSLNNQFRNASRYSNGIYFIPGNSNGSFMTSTNGTTWTNYTIPGASAPVSEFAYDGTTFYFATQQANAIWRTQTLGSYSSINLPTGTGENKIANVAVGNGKVVVSSTGASTQIGNTWISEDDGLTFFIIDPDDNTFVYGNRAGSYNISSEGSSIPGRITDSATIMHKYQYDPIYKTFASNGHYGNQVNAGWAEPYNIDTENYYKWTYSHYNASVSTNTAFPFNATLRVITYSEFMGRYYYMYGLDDSNGASLGMSYDPVTQNTRTEPIANGYSINSRLSSDVQSNHYATNVQPNGYYWQHYEEGTTSYVGRRIITDPNIFWTQMQDVVGASFTSAHVQPIQFPDGSMLWANNGGTSTSFIQSFGVSATGTKTAALPMGDTTEASMATAIYSGNVDIDETTSTFSVNSGRYRWADMPYPVTSPWVPRDYLTTYPTTTTFVGKAGPVFLIQNNTNEIGVSFNNGVSFITYPSLSSITKVIEKQGVYYVLSDKSIYRTTDWSTSQFELVGTLPEAPYLEMWANIAGSPLSAVGDPHVMNSNGGIYKMFTSSNSQPEANVFVYDMNLQEL
jgi:hypothetical protein